METIPEMTVAEVHLCGWPTMLDGWLIDSFRT